MPALGLLAGARVGNIVGLAIPVILANFAKRIYIDHALRRIRKIDERNLSSEERDAQIERAGGASIPDAVFWRQSSLFR